jgi:hypothetical protein
MLGEFIFCALMCFVFGYLIGGRHGIRASENLRAKRGTNDS